MLEAVRSIDLKRIKMVKSPAILQSECRQTAWLYLKKFSHAI